MTVLRDNIITFGLGDLIGFGATLNPDGSILAITGPTIRRSAVDPNGGVTAIAGSLALAGTGLYVNLNGATAWGRTGGLIFDTTENSAPITNTAAETAFSTGVCTIPANVLKAGSQVRVRLFGVTPNTNVMDTLQITVRFGATGVAAQIVTQTTAIDVNNLDVFTVDVLISIRTAGAPGSMVANGLWVLGVPDTATARADRMALANIDTTVAQDITVTALWSAADPGNQAVLEGMSVWVD